MRATRSRWSAGRGAPSLAGSELAKLWGLPLPDGLPGYDLALEARTIATVRDAVRAGGLSSAHDIAEGGLLVALAECCLAGGIGAQVPALADATPERLFGERRGGWVLSGPREVLETLPAPVTLLGTVGGDALRLGDSVAWSLGALSGAHAALAPLFP